jgi:hypothetical protein
VEVSNREDRSEDVEEAEDVGEAEDEEEEEEDSTITIADSIKVHQTMSSPTALSFTNQKTTSSSSALIWVDSLSSTVEFIWRISRRLVQSMRFWVHSMAFTSVLSLQRELTLLTSSQDRFFI